MVFYINNVKEVIMADRNQVVREGSRIVKTFGSHLDYVKEQSIYKKLKGTGLAPKLFESMGDCIEHEFIDGISLYDAIKQNNDNIEKLEGLFEIFTVWYASYRQSVNLSLGKADFNKFILAEDKLVCIDFEHCKPGYPEEDIAALITQISDFSIETAALFSKVCTEKLSLDPEIIDRLDKVK